VPARPDTRWWWTWVLKAHEIRLLKGRLRFTRPDKSSTGATFPSALLFYRSGPEPPAPHIWHWDWRTAIAA